MAAPKTEQTPFQLSIISSISAGITFIPTSFCSLLRALTTLSGLPVMEKVTTSETFILDTTILSTPVNFAILSQICGKSFAFGFANCPLANRTNSVTLCDCKFFAPGTGCMRENVGVGAGVGDREELAVLDRP